MKIRDQVQPFTLFRNISDPLLSLGLPTSFKSDLASLDHVYHRFEISLVISVSQISMHIEIE